jgi:hypothetical protein
MAELPEGTVTFLLTDPEGSTRLLEAHPDAYRVTVPGPRLLPGLRPRLEPAPGASSSGSMRSTATARLLAPHRPGRRGPRAVCPVAFPRRGP